MNNDLKMKAKIYFNLVRTKKTNDVILPMIPITTRPKT